MTNGTTTSTPLSPHRRKRGQTANLHVPLRELRGARLGAGARMGENFKSGLEFVPAEDQRRTGAGHPLLAKLQRLRNRPGGGVRGRRHGALGNQIRDVLRPLHGAVQEIVYPFQGGETPIGQAGRLEGRRRQLGGQARRQKAQKDKKIMEKHGGYAAFLFPFPRPLRLCERQIGVFPSSPCGHIIS